MLAQSDNPATIRPATLADATGIAETHVASWKATYPGIVPREYLDGLKVSGSEELWRGALSAPAAPSIFVAEREGTICGFAAGGPARQKMTGYAGELYAIYLHPEVCGLGIGAHLFRTVDETLKCSGLAGLYVWVLADIPSRGFYERMGGKPLTSSVIEIGG